MSEEKWEYCELGLAEVRFQKKGKFGGKEGWSFDCFIKYFTLQGPIIYALSTLEELRQTNPFDQAVAMLGTYGWELISVQHPTVQTQSGGYHATGTIPPPIEVDSVILWDRVVAYFKRPAIQGRAVNEPKLII